jgi:hypothetical protein
MVAFNPALLLGEGVFTAGRYSPLPMSLNANASTLSSSAGTTVSASVTTTVANTILVAIIDCTSTSLALTVSSVATAGLTWTKRVNSGSVSFDSGTRFGDFEIWWAPCPTAGAHTALVTFSGSTEGGITLLAVAGVASSTAPWALSSSKFAFQNTAGASAVAPSFTGITTTDANTFVIAGATVIGVGTFAPPGAGAIDGTTATLIHSGPDGNGDYLIVEYEILTSAASSLSAAFTGADQYWMGAADALAG